MLIGLSYLDRVIRSLGIFSPHGLAEVDKKETMIQLDARQEVHREANDELRHRHDQMMSYPGSKPQPTT